MPRLAKVAKLFVLSVAGLLVLVVAVALIVVRTDWFRNYVREKIVAATEEATGGKVELSSFDFGWLRGATIDGFVIHGTEPAGSPPLFRARRVQLQLKLLSSVKHAIDLQSLSVDEPQANVIVYPDGSNNIPAPKITKPGDKSALQTVVDLAIHRFDLRNGSVSFAMQKIPLDLRGENLTAQLFYNPVHPSYRGRIGLDPLFTKQGRNQPLKVSITIPLLLETDRIQVTEAKLGMPQSQIIVSGDITHLSAPRMSAHVGAHLSLQEVRNVANLPISAQAKGTLDLDASATGDGKTIKIESARAALGRSRLEASGTLEDNTSAGGARFRGSFDLNELGKLFEIAAQPTGTLEASGNARLMPGSEYVVTGNLLAHNVSFLEGGRRFSGIGLKSAISADPRKIELAGMRLTLPAGSLTGRADLEDSRYFHLAAQLHGIDTLALGKALSQSVPYDGIISGPLEAHGDLKARGTKGITGRVRLAIAPGPHGVPVSGRLVAAYNGAADSIQLSDSYLVLPNSRLDLSGTAGSSLHLRLVSKNLSDFRPAIQGELPIALERGGAATFEGDVTGPISDPKIAGHLALNHFAVEHRTFEQFATDINASQSAASIQHGTLTRGAMSAQFAANVGLRKWSPEPQEPLRVTATISNGDLADLMALAGQKDLPVSGNLSASADIAGTVGNPTGGANLTVVSGSAYDQPLDRVDARIDFADRLVKVPSATVVSGASRLVLTASFQHPRDSLSTGHIQAHVNGTEIALAGLKPLEKERPGLDGIGQVDATVAADLTEVHGKTEFEVTAVNGNATLRGLRDQHQNYGDLTANVQTAGSTVNYRVDSDFAKSAIHINGQTRLAPEYPTTAHMSIANLPIEQVLAIADQKSIDAKGMLSASADVSGTLDHPQGNADVTIAKAVIEGEPIDKLETRVSYQANRIDLPLFTVTGPSAHLALNATYDHAPNDLENGSLRFQMAKSSINLAKSSRIQKGRPGLSGTVQVSADGTATIRKTAATPEVLFSMLNLDLQAASLAVNRAPLGGLHLTAQTHNNALDFNLDSDLAKASIKGSGQAQLSGDYPVNAKITVANLAYAALEPLLNGDSEANEFDAVLDANLTASGPAMKPEQLTGKLEVTRLQLTGTASQVAIRNQGPIVVTMAKSAVRVESAHLTGPQTDIQVTGTATLTGTTALNLNVAAKTNLGILQQMRRDIYAAGEVSVQAVIRGTLSQPQMNGRLQFENASFNMADLPNGLSNANGLILFSGNTATIDHLTGESGGGKVSITGSAGYGAYASYGLKITATRVRVRYPPGASISADADLALNGTTQRSVVSGTVTVRRIAFSPKSDFGSVLTRAAPPAETPSVPSGPLAGMRLDIRIRTGPALSLETSLAENLQADADLTLRGTVSNPGMVGRVNVTSGTLVFFGTKFDVNQGSISFFNPSKIDPILDIDLETNAKGVDVTLNVSGPVENMKLTYHSDPPLQFSEVALLATGKAPTSDPTLVANQPAAAPQSLEQMGESALVSEAIANPVSSRLQRVFGVTKLKVDPTFVSGSSTPQARLTLQQQVTKSLTFTYVQDLSLANSEILRVEWAINRHWSAVASRDEYGRFGVDFFLKKQFR